jgi:hypothetical protein
MALLGGTGLAAPPMRRLPLLAGLIGLAAVELWFAARSLPDSHPTAAAGCLRGTQRASPSPDQP